MSPGNHKSGFYITMPTKPCSAELQPYCVKLNLEIC